MADQAARAGEIRKILNLRAAIFANLAFFVFHTPIVYNYAVSVKWQMKILANKPRNLCKIAFRPKCCILRSVAQLGRPSSFTQQTADEICERLSAGETLKAICESENIPSFVTVFKWLNDFPEFLNQYARAREVQCENMAEEILRIADGADMETYNPARLQVDTRKWLLSKRLPKKYGDSLNTTVDGTLNVNVNVSRINGKPEGTEG